MASSVYNDSVHKDALRLLFQSVQLFPDKFEEDAYICPMCFKVCPGSKPEKPDTTVDTWIEGHHFGYALNDFPAFMSHVPACIQCHTGEKRDWSKSKLHHPDVWVVSKTPTKNLSHNVVWFRWYARFRWWGLALALYLFRRCIAWFGD